MLAHSFRERIADEVRSEIIAGRLHAGTVYSARALADRFGVSATPVREAMMDLAAHGLVEPVRNRGYCVTVPRSADLAEIFNLRLMMEVPLIGLATRLASDEQLDVVPDHVETMRDLAAQRDVGSFLQAERDFHVYLAALSGNRRGRDIITMLRDQVRGPSQDAAAGFGPSMDDIVAEHERLAAAVCERNAEAAVAAMRDHLVTSRRSVASRNNTVAEHRPL